MAAIELITDYTSTDTSIEKLFKDSAVDEATRACIDFLDPNCYAAAAVPSGAVASGLAVKNLTEAAVFTATISTTNMTVSARAAGNLFGGMVISAGAAAGTIIQSQTSSSEPGGALGGAGVYVVSISQTIAAPVTMTAVNTDAATSTAFPSGVGSAGLIFEANNRSVDLPTTVKMPASATFYGVGIWIKPIARVAATSETLMLYGSSYTNSQFILQRTSGDQLTYQFIGPNNSFMNGIGVNLNEVAHLAMTVEVSGGSAVTKIYKNGVLLQTGSAVALSGGVLPTPGGTALLGRGAFANGFSGAVGRFDHQDFSATGSRSVTAWLARCYGDNVGRFT